MDLNSFFLLFPSIFMLHEFEEILLFPRFMRRNLKLQQQFLSLIHISSESVCKRRILSGAQFYSVLEIFYKRRRGCSFIQALPFLLLLFYSTILAMHCAMHLMYLANRAVYRFFGESLSKR